MSYTQPLSGSAPTLTLLPPSAPEQTTAWTLSSTAWKGPLSVPDYIRRETHLANQAATREGGIQHWILCDAEEPLYPAGQESDEKEGEEGGKEDEKQRTILASCETIRRKALVAFSLDGSVQIQETLCYGIAAVFCRPEFQRRGYASRMMRELAIVLGGWKGTAAEGVGMGLEKCLFSVLYSDLGKDFYAKFAWHPFPSAQLTITVSLPTSSYTPANLLPSSPLTANDLGPLCDLDIKLLYATLKKTSNSTSEIAVIMLPDLQTLQWHHAREEFMGQELFGRKPGVKGAVVGSEEGKRAWVVWMRDWVEVERELVGRLYLLRLVVEGDDEEEKDGGEEARGKIVALLRAAVKEAAEWKLKEVQIWNPNDAVIRGAKVGFGESAVKVVEREVDNVCCLRWEGGEYDDKFGGTSFRDVTWVGNERYGWL